MCVIHSMCVIYIYSSRSSMLPIYSLSSLLFFEPFRVAARRWILWGLLVCVCVCVICARVSARNRHCLLGNEGILAHSLAHNG